MATEYGFIYFLANECMPGIYKIGFTTNHPKARLDQLSAATACPTPFELVAAFGTSAPREVEQDIHRELDMVRVNRSREFFRLDADYVVDLCRQYGDPSDDLFMTYRAEMMASEEAEEKDIAWKKAYFESQNADPIFWPKTRGFARYNDEIPF